MIRKNLVRRLEQLEAELTPSKDNQQVLEIVVRRLGQPDTPDRTIELRPPKPNRWRRPS
jgi:hypothetical protein